MERITDHVEQGLMLLISQFQNKPRIAGWAVAYLNQCQELEDAIWDVLIERMLDNAVGEQLDAIGRIVGEGRHGNIDPTYLAFIKARIRINRSRGSTKDMLEVLGMITATSVIFTEYQPACFFLELLTIPDEDPVLLYQLLADTKAGGVKLTMISPTSDTVAAQPMTYNGTSAPAHACGDARDLAATIVSSGASPYALTDGMTLTMTVDGTELWSFTFHTSDFVAIGAATPAEVVAVINRTRRRRMNATVDGGNVRITTYRKGATASVLVTGGTANTPIGFSGVIQNGTGDTTFGLLSDAVTVRDPAAAPVIAPPGPPFIVFLDPGTGF